jgi:4-hydroxy-2-oxoheptanedioate aldolase
MPIPFGQSVHVLARSGFDFMIIDLEHEPVDTPAAHTMIAATGGTPLAPLVRITGKEPWHAKIPLDLGSMGVCLPMSSADALYNVTNVAGREYPADASFVPECSHAISESEY